jgi:hypothetical protein
MMLLKLSYYLYTPSLQFDQNDLGVQLGSMVLMEKGQPLPFDKAAANKYLKVGKGGPDLNCWTQAAQNLLWILKPFLPVTPCLLGAKQWHILMTRPLQYSTAL